MTVTIDTAHEGVIHPIYKKPVGERLGLQALHTVYGDKDITPCGPIYQSMTVKDNAVYLSFKYVDGGPVLVKPRHAHASGFVIAGADKRFVPAHARIVHSSPLSSHQIMVWSDEVTKPAAVRYAWADYPPSTLYNKAALPASPFRTDDWAIPELGSEREYLHANPHSELKYYSVRSR